MNEWMGLVKTIKTEVENDRISLVAAAVAYYALFSIFPLLIATVSIYGLFADPTDVARQIQAMKNFMPLEALGVINAELNSIVRNSSGSLGLGVIASILLTLWTASKGTKVLMEAMNIAYGEKEERSFIRFNLTALLLTLGAVLTLILAVGSLVVLPAVMSLIDFNGLAGIVVRILRWPLLLLIFLTGLSLLYRFGPSRRQVHWRWMTAGGLITTLLILLASVGLAYYVEAFGNYNKTYGSLAGVIVLLLWLYLLSYSVLLGVELNAILDSQGRSDMKKSGTPKLVVKTDPVHG